MQLYRDECIAALNSVDLNAVESVTQTLLEARGRGANVFVIGNGGSAATASHMATDLMMGSGLVDPPLRVIALTDNQAIITATGSPRKTISKRRKVLYSAVISFVLRQTRNSHRQSIIVSARNPRAHRPLR